MRSQGSDDKGNYKSLLAHRNDDSQHNNVDNIDSPLDQKVGLVNLLELSSNTGIPSDSDSSSLLKLLYHEALVHFSIAWPVCASFSLRKTTDVVSVMFIGYLGSSYLAAAGLASVTANVTGNSVINGFAGALTTFCSQAVGMNDKEMLSQSLQRAVLLLYICICIPVTILWLFSENIMIYFGILPETAYHASKYLHMLTPGMWAFATSICIQNWLFAQSNAKPITTITMITASMHPIWCYYFMFHLNIGYLGAAISISITKLTELICLLVYVTCISSVIKDSGFTWQIKASFTKWLPFLKISLPNILMMMEWWASEIIIFMAGSLPNSDNQVSAMSIYQIIIAMCFMLPQGFHVSGSTRVGNLLGANNHEGAKIAAIVSPVLSIILSSILSIFLAIFRIQLGELFISDRAVLEILMKIIPILIVYIIADGAQTAMTGVLKGLGKQRIGGPIVILSYCFIGIPISYVLTFTARFQMGIVGLCIGTTIGTWVHMILYGILLMNMNWEKEADNIQKSRASVVSTEKIEKPGSTTNSSSSIYSEESEDAATWWDDVELLVLPDYEVPSLPSRTRTFDDVRVSAYNRIANIFGWEKMISEYEMVKQYTEVITNEDMVI